MGMQGETKKRKKIMERLKAVTRWRRIEGKMGEEKRIKERTKRAN